MAKARSAIKILAIAGILLLFVRAALLLAQDPCRGVADNNDYWRVARPAGIETARQKRPGVYVVCSYPVGESRLASGFSSPALAAWLARPLDWGLRVPAGRFDLRQVGLLYFLLSVILFAGALRLGLPVLLAFLFAWVLTDPGFLLFFNSLYADPALIVSLLGVAMLMPLAPFERAGEGPRAHLHRGLLVLLLGLAAAAGFSRMQYALFPLALAITYGLAALAYRQRPAAAQMAFIAALAIVGMAAIGHFLWGSGPRFLAANNYNAVYGGIARVASDRDGALAFLDIPAHDRARPTEDYFAARVGRQPPEVPALQQLSRLRLAWLYLRDPDALARTADTIERIFREVRAHPRGTTTRAESRSARREESTFWQFSRWRTAGLRLLPSIFPWLVLLTVALVLAVRGARRSWSAICSLLLFLAIWITSQMAVALLGEGFVNLHQHLVGARLGFDSMMVTLLFVGSAAAWRQVSPSHEGMRRPSAEAQAAASRSRVAAACTPSL